MIKHNQLSNLSNTNKKNKIYGKKNSPEPNDGLFIEKNPNDSFSAEGTVRYGEETDVDDI
jgi:hypothetical protein